VMVLPHFSPTGPPQFIGDSCGVMAGLSLATTRGEVLKGLLEGVTFYIRACLESLPSVGIQMDRLHVVGGGTKSDAWVQLSADIVARPFVRPKITEAGALGAAILAGAAVGVFSSVAEGCAAMVHLDRTFDPVPERVRAYDARFAEYQRLWPLMADYLRDLARCPGQTTG
jgi:xylulokinase